MIGQEIIDLITSILGGETPDTTYLLQLINLSKVRIENGINPAREDQGSRPWKVLLTLDKTKTVNSSNTYLTAFDLPDNFKRYLGESSLTQGRLILFDGSNNVQYLTEIPYELILENKDIFGYFAVDYSNRQFYITGVVPGTFTIYQWYIKKTEPITLATSWSNFDSDFHPILAFDTAARYRLGTDYDDVNARNADDNIKMVNGIFNAMASWDAEMAISAINNIDYPNVNNSDFRGLSGIGPRGVRV